MYPKLKWRLLFLAGAIALFIFAYYLGAKMQMSDQEARVLIQQFASKNKDINGNKILVNNLEPALGMFLPGFGVGLGIYAAASTGKVFAAATMVFPVLKGANPIVALITPFAILETFAYGLAISRSGILVYQLLRERKLWRQLMAPIILEVAIVVAILIIASVLEMQTISHRRQIG